MLLWDRIHHMSNSQTTNSQVYWMISRIWMTNFSGTWSLLLRNLQCWQRPLDACRPLLQNHRSRPYGKLPRDTHWCSPRHCHQLINPCQHGHLVLWDPRKVIIFAKGPWCLWPSILALGVPSRHLLQLISRTDLRRTKRLMRTEVTRHWPDQVSTGWKCCWTSFHNEQVEDIVQYPNPRRCRWDGHHCLDKGPWIVKIRWQSPPTTSTWTHGLRKSPRLSFIPMSTTSYRSEDFTILCEAPQCRRLSWNSERFTNSGRWRSNEGRVKAAGYLAMKDILFRWTIWSLLSYIRCQE